MSTLRLRRWNERRLSEMPAWVLLLLAAAIGLEIGIAMLRPSPRAAAVDLPMPPSVATLRVIALGDPIPLGQAMALYLQAFDNQPGVSIPFAALDYDRVQAWLGSVLELDPVGQYPLLMASHLYAQVLPRPDKQRVMSEFIYREFFADPNRRWPSLAHVAIMAKHRLHDLPLALRYADAIRDRAHGTGVPSWARQMHIFLREDMGELETAKILLGGLLASGTITDTHELHFLTQRLKEMETAEKSSQSSR
jgi:hypothetical protein